MSSLDDGERYPVQVLAGRTKNNGPMEEGTPWYDDRRKRYDRGTHTLYTITGELIRLRVKSSNVGGRAIRKYHIVWSFRWVGGTGSTMFDVDTTRTKRSCDQEVGRAGISAKHKSTCGTDHQSPENKQTQAPAAMSTGSTNKIKSTCG